MWYFILHSFIFTFKSLTLFIKLKFHWRDVDNCAQKLMNILWDMTWSSSIIFQSFCETQVFHWPITSCLTLFSLFKHFLYIYLYMVKQTHDYFVHYIETKNRKSLHMKFIIITQLYLFHSAGDFVDKSVS